MNYFFALGLPSEIRNEVTRYCQDWRAKTQSIHSAQWLLPEDYHITLKFLGNMNEERVSELVSAALPIAAQQSPLRLLLAPRGTFPSVLWVGVKQDPLLADLALQFDMTFQRLGFRPETRPYKPHITAARLRQRQNITDVELLAHDERTFPNWITNQFVLMQTLPPDKRRNEAKARYNIVHTFPFGKMQS